MKQIRFSSILLIICLTLFASTGFGNTQRKFRIENRNEIDAYCAYVYVDSTNLKVTGHLEYHIEGWVRIPSGRAVTIEYASKYPNLYICLILADGRLWSGNTSTVRFNVPKELTDDSFKVVYELKNGTIGSTHLHASVSDSDLEPRTFYDATPKPKGRNTAALTIPGPVEIKEVNAVEIAEDRDMAILQEELAKVKALRDQLNQSIKEMESQLKHIDQNIKEMESQLNVLQKHPDPKFDGVYDTQGFVRRGKDYALLFATNEYQHWDDLNTPIRDAEMIGAELEKYGFVVHIQRNMKTRADIIRVLTEYAKKDYEPGDQLFVYFAGHGHFDAGLTKAGYIAASNSKLPDEDPVYTTYLSYALLKQDLDRLACLRILLVLDVDYGGTFDENIALGKGASGNDNPSTDITAKRHQPQLNLAETLKVKTRWYLSSGGKEQVADGEGLSNSPFAASLLTLLKSGAGEDGVLTVPEIEQQLPPTLRAELDKFEAAWRNKHPLWDGELTQTPASGPFGSGKAFDKAFVFIKAQK